MYKMNYRVIRSNYLAIMATCFVFLLLYFSTQDQFANRLRSFPSSSTSHGDNDATPEALIPVAKQTPAHNQSEPLIPKSQETPAAQKESGPSIQETQNQKEELLVERSEASNTTIQEKPIIQQTGPSIPVAHEEDIPIPVPQDNNPDLEQLKPFIPDAQENLVQEQLGDGGGKIELFKKPSCDFSDMQFDQCDVEGDVRVHGKSSSVYSVTSIENYISQANNETWSVRPHPRKYATELMSHFREIKVKIEHNEQAPKCDVTHDSAAVIFATGGYNGNYFHDFTDLLVPLFITSYQFKGEVQFLVSNIQHWFIFKYMGLLRKLSNYEIIDYDKEERVHCYRRVIVGTSKHKDLTIEPSRAPNHISTVEFGRFTKMAYSLNRNFAIKLGEETAKKPRLLIMARNHTRALMNREEIIPLIEELGFEVVIGNAHFSMDIGEFARLVNSADVMMGVHGAGLTNFVFLPTNAVLIQIVPLGKYERTCEYDFGEPAVDMGLKYLQYSISQDESTLKDLYPRDHAVLRDPESIHRQGWQVANGIYLGKQNVRLNFTRFRPILERALDLLRE